MLKDRLFGSFSTCDRKRQSVLVVTWVPRIFAADGRRPSPGVSGSGEKPVRALFATTTASARCSSGLPARCRLLPDVAGAGLYGIAVGAAPSLSRAAASLETAGAGRGALTWVFGFSQGSSLGGGTSHRSRRAASSASFAALSAALFCSSSVSRRRVLCSNSVICLLPWLS